MSIFSDFDDFMNNLLGWGNSTPEPEKKLPPLVDNRPANLEEFLKVPPKPEPKPVEPVRVRKHIYYRAETMEHVKTLKRIAKKVRVGYSTTDRYTVYDQSRRFYTGLPDAICPDPGYDTYYITTDEGDNSIIFRLQDISRIKDDLGRVNVYAELSRVR